MSSSTETNVADCIEAYSQTDAQNLANASVGSLDLISVPVAPEPVAQGVLHVNSLALDNGRLAAMATLSQSASFDTACAYISFSSDDFVDDQTTNTLLIYPNYVFSDKSQDPLLSIASSWGFAIGMADYVVLLVECDKFPAPRYNTYLHTFFLTLKANPKPLVILHDTKGTTSYDESLIKLNEILE